MGFDDFPTEPITLIKHDGTTAQAQAVVTPKEMSVIQANFPVEAADTIERRRPDGIVERYEVLDPGFAPPFGGLPAHYSIKVRNLGTRRPEPTAVVHNTTYNNSGQVAAMGPNASAANNVQVLQVQQPWSTDDFARVKTEVSQLRKAYAKRLAETDDDTGEDAIELGRIGEAERAAKNGDQNGVVDALKRLGHKTWDLAQQLGLAYLKLKAGDALGLASGSDG
jgi:hypothetical protein